jgi:hypothetical protein
VARLRGSLLLDFASPLAILSGSTSDASLTEASYSSRSVTQTTFDGSSPSSPSTSRDRVVEEVHDFHGFSRTRIASLCGVGLRSGRDRTFRSLTLRFLRARLPRQTAILRSELLGRASSGKRVPLLKTAVRFCEGSTTSLPSRARCDRCCVSWRLHDGPAYSDKSDELNPPDPRAVEQRPKRLLPERKCVLPGPRLRHVLHRSR